MKTQWAVLKNQRLPCIHFGFEQSVRESYRILARQEWQIDRDFKRGTTRQIARPIHHLRRVEQRNSPAKPRSRQVFFRPTVPKKIFEWQVTPAADVTDMLRGAASADIAREQRAFPATTHPSSPLLPTHPCTLQQRQHHSSRQLEIPRVPPFLDQERFPFREPRQLETEDSHASL